MTIARAADMRLGGFDVEREAVLVRHWSSAAN
jgi:hypothetical protein